MRGGALVLVVTLSACPRPVAESPRADPNVYVGVVASDEERRSVLAWIDEASAVLSSEALVANLRALAGDYPVVFFGDAALAGVPRVERILRLNEPGLRYRRASLSLADGHIASTGASSITLGRVHLQRYASANVVARSCAINTLAHEMTHTIARSASGFVIMDTGTAPPSDETAVVASYLIGAVAQCTWLQARGRLPNDREHLRTCTEVFGVRNFNSLRCDRFTDAQPIELRADLPAPAAPAWRTN